MILPNTFPVKVQFTPKQDTTPFGGVLAFLKILCDRKILHKLPGDRMRSQGWLDAQMVLSIMLLNILGFDRVADIDRLEDDTVLGKIVRQLEPLLFGRRHVTLSSRLRRVCESIATGNNSGHWSPKEPFWVTKSYQNNLLWWRKANQVLNIARIDK